MSRERFGVDLVQGDGGGQRADPATVDPRFLLDEATADRIEAAIAATWPEQIDPSDLGNQALAADVRTARLSLLETLGLAELG